MEVDPSPNELPQPALNHALATRLAPVQGPSSGVQPAPVRPPTQVSVLRGQSCCLPASTHHSSLYFSVTCHMRLLEPGRVSLLLVSFRWAPKNELSQNLLSLANPPAACSLLLQPGTPSQYMLAPQNLPPAFLVPLGYLQVTSNYIQPSSIVVASFFGP